MFHPNLRCQCAPVLDLRWGHYGPHVLQVLCTSHFLLTGGWGLGQLLGLRGNQSQGLGQRSLSPRHADSICSVTSDTKPTSLSAFLGS